MLTTTAVLMSLGMETGNARVVASGQTGTAEVSFASSFEEGTALAGAMRPQIAEAAILENAADSEIVASAKKLNVPALAIPGAKANTRGGGNITSAFDVADELLSPVVPKIVSPTAIGTKMSMGMTGSLLASGKHVEDASAADQIEMPSEQHSIGGAEGIAQELSPDNAESVKAGIPSEAAVPQANVESREKLITTNNWDQSPIQVHKAVIAVEESLDTAPAGKTAKGKDGAGKTHSGEKAEKKERAIKAAKTEKALDAMVPALGIGAQIVTVASITVSSEDQQYESTKQGDVDSFSTVSATVGRSIGLISITDKKAGQKTASAENNEDQIKTPTSVVKNESASKRSEDDVAKMVVPATLATAEGDTKEQIKVANSALMPSANTGVEAPGAVAGVIPGVVPLHVAAKSQIAEASAHAVAVQSEARMQMNPGASDAVGPAPRTLSATPTTLEVGISNGSHGWLKIRAEMTGGGVVNASLSTSSPSGQEMLHRELPSLTAYLQGERVAVNTVVVQPTATAGTDFRGLAAGMNGDGRGHAQQSGGQGGENRQGTSGAVIDRAEKSMSYLGRTGIRGDELLPPLPYVGGAGSWLSVRA